MTSREARSGKVDQAAGEHFLMLDGQRQGPFRLEELRVLWRRGRVDGSTPWWRVGLRDWSVLGGLRLELEEGVERVLPPVAGEVRGLGRGELGQMGEGSAGLGGRAGSGVVSAGVVGGAKVGGGEPSAPGEFRRMKLVRIVGETKPAVGHYGRSWAEEEAQELAQREEEGLKSERTRVVCLVLLWLFGGLGAHYLYAGLNRRLAILWGLWGGALLGWFLRQFAVEWLSFFGTMLSLVCCLAVMLSLLFDLGMILLGAFRDGEGREIERWT